MRSCQIAVSTVAGKKVTTIEGLSPNGTHALQKAWVAEQVPQCGYCQSGQIMQAAALLATNKKPTREQIVAAHGRQHLPLRHLHAHHRAPSSAPRGGLTMNTTYSSALAPQLPGLLRRRRRRSDLRDIRLHVAGATQPTNFKANAWVFIGTDGTVTIMSPAVEMGQGIMTALPACLAEDLDADWAKVNVETAPDDESQYGNPKFLGHMVTVASKAVDGYYEKMRLAGAQARKILLANAAQTWKVPVEELSTEPGLVVHKKSGRKIGYGQLAKTATVPDPLPAVTKADLKPLNQCRFIGKDLARVDIPLKVNGKARYGIDTQLPGMLYASVLHRPVQGEKPDKVDDAAAKAVKGVIAVHPLPNGVAVIGDTVEATMKGKAALKVTWTTASPARKLQQ